MSLKSQLARPTSVISRHFADRYPYVNRLQFGRFEPTADVIVIDGTPHPLSTAARFQPGEVRVPSPTGDWYAAGTTGTAFDYRIRYLYTGADPAGLVAAKGAQLFVRGMPAAWTELAACLPRDPQPIGATEQTDLARLCCVLAWYEQLYRIGRSSPGWATNPVVIAGPDASLRELLNRVDPRMPADIVAMAALYAVELPDLTGAGTVVANPTFARSRDLGGADADLIVDGLLIDLKTTKSPGLHREDWWQLLGYLLADSDDAHRITSVGIYYARFGYLWQWPVDGFLATLAGQDVRLDAARMEFAKVVQSRR